MGLFDKLGDTQFKNLRGGEDNGYSIHNDHKNPTIKNNLRDYSNENKKRITNFLKTPMGIKYLQNQNNLQLSSVQLEKNYRTIFKGGGKLGNIVNSINNRLNTDSIVSKTFLNTYNYDNTLKQIGSDPNLGLHYDRFGVDGILDEKLKYFNISTNNNSGDSSNNRLVKIQKQLQLGIPNDDNDNSHNPLKNIINNSVNVLTNQFLPNRPVISGLINNAATLGTSFLTKQHPKFNKFLGNINKGIGVGQNILSTIQTIANTIKPNNKFNDITNSILFYSNIGKKLTNPENDIIYSYSGGPDSLNGLGVTNIKRYDYTNKQLDNVLSNIKDKISNISYNRITVFNNSISSYISTSGFDFDYNYFLLSAKHDNNVYGDIKSTTSLGIKYTTIRAKNDANKISSEQNRDRLKGNNITYGVNIPGFDRVNKDYKYFTNDSGKTPTYDRNDRKDIILAFAIIDPFTLNENRIVFTAFLNGFSDNTSATWTSTKYLGRSEKHYVYDGFENNISFNFQMPCFNKTELLEKHRAIGQLKSSLQGKYGDNILGGVITKIFLGKYLKGESCIITNLSYTIPDDTGWDVEEELAHVINVSVNATVLFNKLPEYREFGGAWGHKGESSYIKDTLGTFLSESQVQNTTSKALSKINEVQ